MISPQVMKRLEITFSISTTSLVLAARAEEGEISTSLILRGGTEIIFQSFIKHYL